MTHLSEYRNEAGEDARPKLKAAGEDGRSHAGRPGNAWLEVGPCRARRRSPKQLNPSSKTEFLFCNLLQLFILRSRVGLTRAAGFYPARLWTKKKKSWRRDSNSRPEGERLSRARLWPLGHAPFCVLWWGWSLIYVIYSLWKKKKNSKKY